MQRETELNWNNSKTLIITGGNINLDFASSFLLNNVFNNVIAVDGGIESLLKLNLMPTYIIGDFDTVSSEKLMRVKEKLDKEKCIQLVPEKDQTDTQEAMRLAIDLKSEEIVILGGTGSRLDHTIANIHVLQMALNEGVEAYILNENNKIYMINSRHTVEEPYGPYISLLPLTTKVKGVSLTGFKYTLNKYDFELGKSYGIGISNELVDKHGIIEINEGILVVVEAKDSE